MWDFDSKPRTSECKSLITDDLNGAFNTDWHAWLMTKGSPRVAAVILGGTSSLLVQPTDYLAIIGSIAWICGQARVSLVNCFRTQTFSSITKTVGCQGAGLFCYYTNNPLPLTVF